MRVSAQFNKGYLPIRLLVVEQNCNVLANSAIRASYMESVEIKLQRVIQNGEYLQNLEFSWYFFSYF
jgi:hypothetical protein